VTVVVDSSFAIKWLISEPDSLLAIRQLAMWKRERLDRLMPRWAQLEGANSLLQIVHRQQLGVIDAVAHLSELPRFVPLIDSSIEHSRRALVLHHLGLHAVYDLHSLALAEELGCELWTADQRFGTPVSSQFPFVTWLGAIAT